ncbi:hypothetical protein FAIPA1_580017 [Frankia sp. AiPs1]
MIFPGRTARVSRGWSRSQLGADVSEMDVATELAGGQRLAGGGGGSPAALACACLLRAEFGRSGAGTAPAGRLLGVWEAEQVLPEEDHVGVRVARSPRSSNPRDARSARHRPARSNPADHLEMPMSAAVSYAT